MPFAVPIPVPAPDAKGAEEIPGRVGVSMQSGARLEQARQENLSYTTYDSVEDGLTAAIKSAAEDDLVYVGGSSFVVGEALGAAIKKGR